MMILIAADAVGGSVAPRALAGALLRSNGVAVTKWRAQQMRPLDEILRRGVLKPSEETKHNPNTFSLALFRFTCSVPTKCPMRGLGEHKVIPIPFYTHLGILDHSYSNPLSILIRPQILHFSVIRERYLHFKKNIFQSKWSDGWSSHTHTCS